MACRPPSIQTTTCRPRQRPRLLVGQVFGQRSWRCDVLDTGSFLWFSGEVMIAVNSCRPSGLADVGTTVIRSDSLVQLLQVVGVLRVVDEARSRRR